MHENVDQVFRGVTVELDFFKLVELVDLVLRKTEKPFVLQGVFDLDLSFFFLVIAVAIKSKSVFVNVVFIVCIFCMIFFFKV